MVEFPRQELSVELAGGVKAKLQAASQVTVCAVGQGSKLWQRLQLVSVGGEPASRVSEEVVRHFFDYGADIGPRAVSAIREVYARILVKHGGYQMQPGFDLVSRAMGSDGGGFGAVLAAMADGVEAEVAVKQTHAGAALRPFFRICGYEGDPFRAAAGHPALRSGGVVGWQRVAGTKFDSLFHTAMFGGRIIATGLALGRDRESPRLATRELLIDISPLY